MYCAHELLRASFVVVSLSMLVSTVACSKKEAAAGPPLTVPACEEYVSKEYACAVRNPNPTERARKIKDALDDRKKYAEDIKNPKGADMKSVCESMLRMANNPVSSEHKECPTVFF